MNKKALFLGAIFLTVAFTIIIPAAATAGPKEKAEPAQVTLIGIMTVQGRTQALLRVEPPAGTSGRGETYTLSEGQSKAGLTVESIDAANATVTLRVGQVRQTLRPERVAAAGGEHKWPSSAPEFEAFIRAATNVVFMELRTGGGKPVTVSDASQIRDLTSAIRLKPQPPCKCKHIHAAIFQGPSGGLGAYFCDHCIDVGTNTYTMPKPFYDQFKQLTRKDG